MVIVMVKDILILYIVMIILLYKLYKTWRCNIRNNLDLINIDLLLTFIKIPTNLATQIEKTEMNKKSNKNGNNLYNIDLKESRVKTSVKLKQ